MLGFLDVELFLRTRVVPDLDGNPDPHDPHPDPHRDVRQPLATGLAEILVLGGDSPHQRVTAGDLRRWGVSAEDAFRVAHANLRTSTPPGRVELRPDGAPVTVLYGSRPDVASHVRRLDDHLDLPPSGALVALPHARALAVRPLHGPDLARAIGGLLRYARHQYETRPAPLTDQLYWWHGGTLTHQQVAHTGSTITLTPTTGLAAALAALR